MIRKRRAITAGITGLALASFLAACTPESDVTEADQSNIPTEELLGESMTITHEIQHVLPDGVFTVGEEDTIVMTDELPEELNPGDEVEVTGTVEKMDVYQADDIDALQTATDEETATYLINRGEELVLTSAALKPVS
ncbi:hypothetical protein [Kocuria carniphila]|uniref:hypothetical protein n=1 Tax=Kocuria carniphila TaxID=262208 RepID=UPI0028E3A41F|nr:hypothetical protein [Kocuria carniphila]